MIYLGAQNDSVIGPMRPIFNTPLKVDQIDMYTKTDAKPVEIFLDNDQKLKFLLILGPKVAQNWASEAHILNMSESTFNEHVKQ